MIRKISKNEIRERVHVRIRKKLKGTTERPRASPCSAAPRTSTRR